MANHRDRLAAVEEGADEFERVLIRAKLVWIHHAARQDERVIRLGIRLLERYVHGQLVAPFREVPAPDLALDGRDDIRFGAGVEQRRVRLRELHLLETLLDQDRDALALQ